MSEAFYDATPLVDCDTATDIVDACQRAAEREALRTDVSELSREFARGAELIDAVRAANAALPSGGAKLDAGKNPLELLPFDAIEEVGRILEFGAKKYARRNWEKGISYSRVAGAVLRHTFKWIMGEDRDPETGRSHMAHAACECLFLVAFELRGRTDLDDRKA